MTRVDHHLGNDSSSLDVQPTGHLNAEKRRDLLLNLGDVSRPSERSPRRYDIEADWILMSTCNFSCVYCFWDTDQLRAPIRQYAATDRLARFFDGSGLIWLLHLTGGEPFAYPGFTDLAVLLSERHRLSLNTNADSPRVMDFADRVDPSRVEFINVGVHPLERSRAGRQERLVRNYASLRDRGFNVFATCVMYPTLRPAYEDVWTWHRSQGITMIPKALQGHHLGRQYPNDYTAEERDWVRAYAERAASDYVAQFEGLPEPPTINPFMDVSRFLDRLPDYRGQPCGAGRVFVRIRENGDIRRCGPSDVIGNIVDGWFDRRSGPSPCAELECPYFCEKYVVRADRGIAPASPGGLA